MHLVVSIRLSVCLCGEMFYRTNKFVCVSYSSNRTAEKYTLYKTGILFENGYAIPVLCECLNQIT